MLKVGPYVQCYATLQKIMLKETYLQIFAEVRVFWLAGHQFQRSTCIKLLYINYIRLLSEFLV